MGCQHLFAIRCLPAALAGSGRVVGCFLGIAGAVAAVDVLVGGMKLGGRGGVIA